MDAHPQGLLTWERSAQEFQDSTFISRANFSCTLYCDRVALIAIGLWRIYGRVEFRVV